MFPLLPIGIAALVGGAAWVVSKRKQPVMTAERAIIYTTALQTMKNPADMRELAATFAGEGLSAHADMLNKRAALKELSPAVKKARSEAFRKAMKSQDPEAVFALANTYDEIGATGSADALRKYASGL